MTSAGCHERIDELSDEMRDMNRALVSIIKKREAVPWHRQHANAGRAPELKTIPEHNCDEVKEHAAMVLKWIRRIDATFSEEPKGDLFTHASIAHGHFLTQRHSR